MIKHSIIPPHRLAVVDCDLAVSPPNFSLQGDAAPVAVLSKAEGVRLGPRPWHSVTATRGRKLYY